MVTPTRILVNNIAQFDSPHVRPYNIFIEKKLWLYFRVLCPVDSGAFIFQVMVGFTIQNHANNS
jgi:hypothetical protein